MAEEYLIADMTITPAPPADLLAGTRFATHTDDNPNLRNTTIRVLVEDGDDFASIVPGTADHYVTGDAEVSADLRELVALLGPGYRFTGHLLLEPSNHQPPTRVRVVTTGDGHQVVAEQGEFVFRSDAAIPVAPAVVVDLAAARSWLGEDEAGGQPRAASYGINVRRRYDLWMGDEPAVWLVEMLRHLNYATPLAPHVWRTAAGVHVQALAVYDQQHYASGALLLAVEVEAAGGLIVRLASEPLAGDDLARCRETGGQPAVWQLDAAVEALGVAARTVNDLVEHFRITVSTAMAGFALGEVSPVGALLTVEEVCAALTAIRELWHGAKNEQCGLTAGELLAVARVHELLCLNAAQENADDERDGYEEDSTG